MGLSSGGFHTHATMKTVTIHSLLKFSFLFSFIHSIYCQTLAASDLGEIVSNAIRNNSRVVTLDPGAAVSVTAPVGVSSAFQLTITGSTSNPNIILWPSGNAVVLNLAAGSQFVLANLTIVLPASSVQDTTRTLTADQFGNQSISSIINLPGVQMDPSARFVLQNVSIVFSSCTDLLRSQANICAAANLVKNATSNALYYAPQVDPGLIILNQAEPDASSFTTRYTNVRLSCNIPTGSGNADPSSGNATTDQLTSAGLLPVPCVIQPVATAAGLVAALLNMSAADILASNSTGFVALQMRDNISLSGTDWPAAGVPVNHDVQIIGVAHNFPADPFSGYELDLHLVPTFVVLDRFSGSITFTNLAITNMAVGADSLFPISMLVGTLWAVQFDRPQATADNRTMLNLVNCQLVVPEDLFDYLSHWAGIQASQVPTVASTANWLRNNVYFSLQVGQATDHYLLYARRNGQGIFWLNSSITDLPYRQPLLQPVTGVKDLVPGQVYTPLSDVQGVYNATQLSSLLMTPNTAQHLIMLNSMQLTAATFVAAANNSTSSNITDAIMASNVPGNASAGDLSAQLQKAVVILGRPDSRPVALDLGGNALLLNLTGLPAGQRITLQRLTLTGLTTLPGSVLQSALVPETVAKAPVIANMSSQLWAFDFQRRQPKLRVVNVTMYVRDLEVSALQQALSASATPLTSALPVDPSVVTAVQSIFTLATVTSQDNSSISLSDVAYNGVEGSAVIFTSALPQKLLSALPPNFNITPQVVADLVPTPPLVPESSSNKLSGGAIAGIVVGSACICCIFLAATLLWNRRLKRLRQEVDEERAAKTAVINQVGILLSSALNSDAESAAPGSHPFSDHPNSAVLLQQILAASASTSRAMSSQGHDLAARSHASRTSVEAGSGSAKNLSQAHLGTEPGQHFGPGNATMSPSHLPANPSVAALFASLRALQSSHGSLGGSKDGVSQAGSKVGSREFKSVLTTSKEMKSGEMNEGSGRHNRSRPPDMPEPIPETHDVQGSLYDSQHAQHGGDNNDAKAGDSKPGVRSKVSDFVRGSHDVVDLDSDKSRAIDIKSIVEPQGPSIVQLAVTEIEASSNASSAQRTQGSTPKKADKDSTQGSQPPPTPTEAGNSQGTGNKTAKSGGEKGDRGPVLTKGLAECDMEEEPKDVLQRVVQQRKDMQGLDLQNVEFQSILGQGSFGVVYKGRWRSLTVAVKVLMFQDASEAKRIRQRAITEAAINTLLTHDNIINTYTHDLKAVTGNMPDEKHAVNWKLYIIQEFCDAGSLAQAVDKGFFVDRHTKRNNMVYILQVAEDIARGMAYIQENNIIHGDLSSGNILLRHDARHPSGLQAKVGDFGLSRFLEGPDNTHISNVRQGTPFYIAPEVFSMGYISKEADVFSFGVLLWEMFCGVPPWRNASLAAYRHTLDPRTFPYHVPMSCPAEYHALIIACLADNPKERPKFSDLLARISELLRMLQQAISRRAAQNQQNMARIASAQQGAGRTGATKNASQPPPATVTTIVASASPVNQAVQGQVQQAGVASNGGALPALQSQGVAQMMQQAKASIPAWHVLPVPSQQVTLPAVQNTQATAIPQPAVTASAATAAVAPTATALAVAKFKEDIMQAAARNTQGPAATAAAVQAQQAGNAGGGAAGDKARGDGTVDVGDVLYLPMPSSTPEQSLQELAGKTAGVNGISVGDTSTAASNAVQAASPAAAAVFPGNQRDGIQSFRSTPSPDASQPQYGQQTSNFHPAPTPLEPMPQHVQHGHGMAHVGNVAVAVQALPKDPGMRQAVYAAALARPGAQLPAGSQESLDARQLAATGAIVTANISTTTSTRSALSSASTIRPGSYPARTPSPTNTPVSKTYSGFTQRKSDVHMMMSRETGMSQSMVSSGEDFNIGHALKRMNTPDHASNAGGPSARDLIVRATPTPTPPDLQDPTPTTCPTPPDPGHHPTSPTTEAPSTDAQMQFELPFVFVPSDEQPPTARLPDAAHIHHPDEVQSPPGQASHSAMHVQNASHVMQSRHSASFDLVEARPPSFASAQPSMNTAAAVVVAGSTTSQQGQQHSSLQGVNAAAAAVANGTKAASGHRADVPPPRSVVPVMTMMSGTTAAAHRTSAAERRSSHAQSSNERLSGQASSRGDGDGFSVFDSTDVLLHAESSPFASHVCSESTHVVEPAFEPQLPFIPEVASHVSSNFAVGSGYINMDGSTDVQQSP